MTRREAHERHESGFNPAPEDQCETKRWYSKVNDVYGHPLNALRIYKTWKCGPVLQKFYTGVSLLSDDDVESGWSAAEVDCNHSVCHMHPTGHKPPSGEKRRYIEIMRLGCCEDVKKARAKTQLIFCGIEPALGFARKEGGGWDEERVAEIAVRAIIRSGS